MQKREKEEKWTALKFCSKIKKKETEIIKTHYKYSSLGCKEFLQFSTYTKKNNLVTPPHRLFVSLGLLQAENRSSLSHTFIAQNVKL